MVLSQPLDDTASVAISLDVRRARLRRRRRNSALREWAGLAAVTTTGLCLTAIALITLLGH